METRATIKNHPLVIVLSPECDLEWDYQARKDESVQDTKMMSHVLLCDLEDRAVLWQTRLYLVTMIDELRRIGMKGTTSFGQAKWMAEVVLTTFT